MDEHGVGFEERFRPLRPASPARLVAAFLLGPMAWVAAVLAADLLISPTEAIETGLLVTAASFAIATVVLSLLRLGRLREERRYEDRD
jgi:hypothetical protein